MTSRTSATAPPRCYRYAGHVFSSTIPVREAEPVPRGKPDIRFVLERTRAPIARATSRGEWPTIAREGNQYFLRFEDLAEFRVTSAGAEVRCRPHPKVPRSTIRHLLLDHVLPRVLSLRGNLVLHASAVATPWGAAAFLADTGQGKSTLAAGFAQSGHPLLADDALILRRDGPRYEAVPTYPALRLWPENLTRLFEGRHRGSPVAHYTTKVRIGAGRGAEIPFATGSVPLALVFLLDPRAEGPLGASVARIGGPTAAKCFLQHSFRMETEDPERVRQAFDEATHAARAGVLRRLSYLREHRALPALRKKVLAVLEEEARAGAGQPHGPQRSPDASEYAIGED